MRVLVADGDETFRRVVRTTLDARGHVVETADTGLAARTGIILNEPDLVIVATLLPDGDGLAWASRLRHHGGKIGATPIIVVSDFWRAGGDRSDAIRLLQLVDFLVKPIEPACLVAVVEGVAAGPHRAPPHVVGALQATGPSRAVDAFLTHDRLVATDLGVDWLRTGCVASLPDRLGGLRRALIRAHIEPPRPGPLAEAGAIAEALEATAEAGGLAALADIMGRLRNALLAIDLSALPGERGAMWARIRTLHQEAWMHIRAVRPSIQIRTSAARPTLAGCGPGNEARGEAPSQTMRMWR